MLNTTMKKVGECFLRFSGETNLRRLFTDSSLKTRLQPRLALAALRKSAQRLWTGKCRIKLKAINFHEN